MRAKLGRPPVLPAAEPPNSCGNISSKPEQALHLSKLALSNQVLSIAPKSQLAGVSSSRLSIRNPLPLR